MKENQIMFIKAEGAYIALSDHSMLLFRAVGSFPFFKIQKAIVLDDFASKGELTIVPENSVEVQMLVNHPELFAFVQVSSIAEGLRSIDRDTAATTIGFDIEMFTKYKDRLILADQQHSGVNVNTVIGEIVYDYGISIPQARLVIQQLRKKINKYEDSY